MKERLGEDENEQALLLDIERARVMLLCYCNIPLGAEMPQGLFEAWCIAAEELFYGTAGRAASISEGDVSISFKKDGADGAALGWKTIADRFKRILV